MIVSHQHEYIFFRVPHTASSALGVELRSHYGAHTARAADQSLIRKHARIPEARAALGDDVVDAYFTFCGVRNPLDLAVTRYLRLKSDPHDAFTQPEKWKRNGGWVTDSKLEEYRLVVEEGAGFADWLRVAQVKADLPMVRECDFHIRFEHLQEDFAEALRRIGVEQIRPLPLKNRTAGKSDRFESYYDDEAKALALEQGAKVMRELGYDFPASFAGVDGPRRPRLLRRGA